MDGVVGSWASLPDDLLVSIFLLLDSTAIVRSAGSCRPWRRAIIGNASRLGPFPVLLLGFFHRERYVHHRLRRPPPPANVLTTAAADIAWTDYWRMWSYQATSPLSSRDGFVLIAVASGEYLCLCDALTGTYTYIPAAALDVPVHSAAYILITSHDDIISPPVTNNGGGGRSSAVWRILAVKRGEKEDVKPGMTYQIFSPDSGMWGPVKRSARFEDGRAPAYMYGKPTDVVVCRGGVVYWLGKSIKDGRHRHGTRRVVFGLDVLTERAWMMDLPEKYLVLDRYRSWRYSFALATSEDGRLSLIASLCGHKIEVWVLVGGDGLWTLRRTIDVHGMLLFCGQRENGHVKITVFCPRSRCLVAQVQHMNECLFIPIDGGSPRLMKTFKENRLSCYPYEMDWSTYISRMKYF